MIHIRARPIVLKPPKSNRKGARGGGGMEDPGEGRGEVLREADGRRGDGRGEADEERDPAGEEAEDGMIEPREESVFASGLREGGPKLAVAQGAASRDQA